MSKEYYTGWSFNEIQFDFNRINDENAIRSDKKHEADVHMAGLLIDTVSKAKGFEGQYERPRTKSEVSHGIKYRRKLASNVYNKDAATQLIKEVNQIDSCVLHENAKKELSIEEKMELKEVERFEKAMESLKLKRGEE